LEGQQTAFGKEFAAATQDMIELILPAIDGVGFQAMGAALLDQRRARPPLLQDG
jgi:hypothetical protein